MRITLVKIYKGIGITLVKIWRGLGIRCAVYLDDGIISGKSFVKPQIICENIVKRDLRDTGLTLNLKKTHLTNSKQGTSF